MRLINPIAAIIMAAIISATFAYEQYVITLFLFTYCHLVTLFIIQDKLGDKDE